MKNPLKTRVTNRTRIGLAGFLLSLVAPAIAIEKPAYEVIGQDGPVEIRRYAPYLVAETFVEGDFDQASGEGFGRLFRYITGANVGSAKISMTAPVGQAAGQPAGEAIDMTAPVGQAAAPGGYWVSFVVPSAYTLATVPKPTDPRVRIREIPARVVAAFTYSGSWSEARDRRVEANLRAAIGAQGLVPVGEPELARYDPPFTPPFLRRNEILIPVAGVATAGPLMLGARPLAAN